MATSTKIDITGAVRKLNLAQQVAVQEAETLVLQAAKIGIEAARGKLDTSYTRGGMRRMARGIGNSAGRNKTGLMINSLKLLGVKTTNSTVGVKLGWSEDSYFKFQEKGTRGSRAIPAANSLMSGRRAIENELPRLRRNMLQRIRKRVSAGK